MLKSLRSINRGFLYTGFIILILITLYYPKEHINSLSIILFTVYWLFDSPKHIRKIFNNNILLIHIVFFVTFIYGFLISENTDNALRIVVKNLSFIILPLLFNTIGGYNIRINVIKMTWVVITFLASVYCQVSNIFYWKWVNSFSTNDFSALEYFTHPWFTYSILAKSIRLQPSYFSIYILLAMIFMLEYLFQVRKKNRYVVYSFLFIISFFIIFIFQLSVRIAIIVFFLMAVYYFFKVKSSRKKKLWIASLFLVFFSVLTINSRFAKRIFEVALVFESKIDSGDNVNNVKKVRLIAIKAFLDQRWQSIVFGLGTGDSQEYLDDYYEEHVINSSKNDHTKKWKLKGLHFHNQFLQNFAETGIFGFIVIILLVGISLREAILCNDKEYILFVSVCILFLLSDSFLVRHKGIVFFVLFNLIFMIKNSNKDEVFVYLN